MGLFDIFDNSNADDARAAKIAGLQAGYKDLSTQYGQGRDVLSNIYNISTQPLNTVFNNSQGGSNAYGDASGANGSAGYARAVDNFHTSPNFNFQLDTGLQAIDRGAASRGMVGSGNTLMAEQKYGNDLANGSFKDYLAGLQPYLGQGTTAAQSIGVLGANQGQLQNASFMKQGDAANGMQTGIGDATAAADLAHNNSSANLFGTLMGGAKLAAGFI